MIHFMDDQAYTLSERRVGRKYWNIFTVLNTLSFTLLIGNFLTIYALRLGATGIHIGILSSLTYISFFFMPLGKKLVSRVGVVRSMGTVWLLRYLVCIPMAVSPLLAISSSPGTALLMVFVGVSGFHFFRGLGVVSNSPLIGELSAGRDRGMFLSRMQILTHVASIGSGLAVAFVLGRGGPLIRYMYFMISGLAAGVIGALLLLLKIPEPPTGKQSASERLLETARTAFAKPTFRKFIFGFAFFLFIASMTRPFIVVYAKTVYSLSDSRAVFFSVVGNLRAIVMGLMARHLLDRFGAKPIILIGTVIATMSLLPAILSPQLSATPLMVFLFVLFFVFHFGSVGAENAGQTYFYNIISQRERINLGMIYFLTLGATGALGSLVGGFLLDLMEWSGIADPVERYRLFFSGISILTVVTFGFLLRIERLGAHSVISTLSTMFSLRDLRAIALLSKLDNTISIDEERQVIREIASSQSTLPVDDILKKLVSPSFIIRSEALFTLEKLPSTDQVEQALIEHVKAHEFTTAYHAARIIGQKGFIRSIPVLREALASEDYLLVSRAMISLAQLGDRDSIGRVESIIQLSRNPMILIHGASALKLFASPGSVDVLLSILKRRRVPPFLREEVIFAIAGIIGIEDWFYPFFMMYRENPGEGLRLLRDEIRSVRETMGTTDHAEISSLCSEDMLGSREHSERAASLLRNFGAYRMNGVAVGTFAEEVLSPELFQMERFSFFINGLLIWLHVNGREETTGVFDRSGAG